jgi:hypothetical protein
MCHANEDTESLVGSEESHSQSQTATSVWNPTMTRLTTVTPSFWCCKLHSHPSKLQWCKCYRAVTH